METVLNTPIKIYNRVIPNRIVFQPMEGCDGTRDGGIDELTRRRYIRFAKSGAGIIWFEATAVSAEGRANPRQLYINDKTVESFRTLVAEIKKISLEENGFEPLIIVQLTHSGRYSKPNGTPEPIVAYRNEHWEKGREDQPYVIATDDYCKSVAEKYGIAAKLSQQAGFDGIDIKCCHGYLFNEFLSASNRDGVYGGSLENRTRLYFECIDAVKNNVDDNIFITTRFNACDCFPYPYGYGVDENNNIDLTEAKIIMEKLAGKGMEIIDITLGNPYLIPHINRPCTNSPEDGNVGLKRIYDVTKELSLKDHIDILKNEGRLISDNDIAALPVIPFGVRPLGEVKEVILVRERSRTRLEVSFPLAFALAISRNIDSISDIAVSLCKT